MMAAFPRACLVLLLAAIPAASRPAPVTLDAISANFWNNLADPACGKAPPRWRVHYGDVPKRLGLIGSGVIGLGSPPSDEQSPCVRFEVLRFADTEPQAIGAARPTNTPSVTSITSCSRGMPAPSL